MRLFRGRQRHEQQLAESAGRAEVAPGDVVILEGTETVRAVGESHYQAELTAICGKPTEDGHCRDVIALLVPEPDNPHDKNAVGVVISGRKVGHLSRADASRWHAALAKRIGEEGRPVGCRAQIRGGWERGAADTGMFGVELYVGLDPAGGRTQEAAGLPPPIDPALAAARERLARKTPPGSSKDGLYKGRHYTEYVEEIKAMKREGAVQEAVDLLCHLLDAIEDEAAAQHWGVAPFYYEQLAIEYRKQKDYAAEVAVLERYHAQPKAPGASPPQLAERLAKARKLLAADS